VAGFGLLEIVSNTNGHEKFVFYVFFFGERFLSCQIYLVNKNSAYSDSAVYHTPIVLIVKSKNLLYGTTYAAPSPACHASVK
jgi:hypothetical protein